MVKIKIWTRYLFLPTVWKQPNIFKSYTGKNIQIRRVFSIEEHFFFLTSIWNWIEIGWIWRICSSFTQIKSHTSVVFKFLLKKKKTILNSSHCRDCREPLEIFLSLIYDNTVGNFRYFYLKLSKTKKFGQRISM